MLELSTSRTRSPRYQYAPCHRHVANPRAEHERRGQRAKTTQLHRARGPAHRTRASQRGSKSRRTRASPRSRQSVFTRARGIRRRCSTWRRRLQKSADNPYFVPSGCHIEWAREAPFMYSLGVYCREPADKNDPPNVV